jgi:flagellar hook assembly protein FlgD
MAVALEEGNTAEMNIQAFPNPFSSYTQVDFDLPVAGEVAIDVVDMFGKTVARLNDGFMTQGMHSVKWHGNTLEGAPAANGVYMIVFKTGGSTQIEKVVLNR